MRLKSIQTHSAGVLGLDSGQKGTVSIACRNWMESDAGRTYMYRWIHFNTI